MGSFKHLLSVGGLIRERKSELDNELEKKETTRVLILDFKTNSGPGRKNHAYDHF